jgi:branched-chain amino acid transport system substrate-binding protein
MSKKNIFNRTLIGVVFLSIALLFLPGIGHSVPLSAGDILIGAIWDLSGTASMYGLCMSRSMGMVIEEINARGGIRIGGKTYTLKGVVEDDGYVADRAVAASYKLVGQGAKFIINLGSTAPAVQTATEPAKVLFFPTISIDKILINKPYTFRIYPIIAVNSVILLEYLQSELPAGQKVYVVQPDDPSGREIKDVWKRFAPAYGLKLVGEDLYSPKTIDFSPLVTRVLLQKPDILIVRGLKSGASFSKGVLAQGYGGRFIIPTDYPPTWIDDVGSEELGDGRLIAPSPNLRKNAPEKIRNLATQYYNKYKEEIFSFGPYVYNYIELIIQAIDKAGTAIDTDKIKSILETQEFDLPWGKVKFGGEEIYGRPGDGFFPVFITEYRHSEKDLKLLSGYSAVEAMQKYLKSLKSK